MVRKQSHLSLAGKPPAMLGTLPFPELEISDMGRTSQCTEQRTGPACQQPLSCKKGSLNQERVLTVQQKLYLFQAVNATAVQ